MNLIRVGLVGLFCALVGTGVAAAANGSTADSGAVSHIAPVAQSGNTGNVNVSSQASNSGNTGNATSTAIANPESHAGGAGAQGGSGATNTGRTGQALSKQEARPRVNNGAGNSDASAIAQSSANSGAKGEAVGTSGNSGAAANGTAANAAQLMAKENGYAQVRLPAKTHSTKNERSAQRAVTRLVPTRGGQPRRSSRGGWRCRGRRGAGRGGHLGRRSFDDRQLHRRGAHLGNGGDAVELVVGRVGASDFELQLVAGGQPPRVGR